MLGQGKSRQELHDRRMKLEVSDPWVRSQGRRGGKAVNCQGQTVGKEQDGRLFGAAWQKDKNSGVGALPRWTLSALATSDPSPLHPRPSYQLPPTCADGRFSGSTSSMALMQSLACWLMWAQRGLVNLT